MIVNMIMKPEAGWTKIKEKKKKRKLKIFELFYFPLFTSATTKNKNEKYFTVHRN